MSFITITHEGDTDLVYTVDNALQLDMGHTESELAWVRAEKQYYVFDGDNWKRLIPVQPSPQHTITMSDVNTEIEIVMHDMDLLESKLTMSVDAVIKEQNQRYIDQHKANDTVRESFEALAEVVNQHSTDLNMVKADLKSIDQSLDNQGNAIAHGNRINKDLLNNLTDKLTAATDTLSKFNSDIETLKNMKPETKSLWVAIISVALIELARIVAGL